MDLLVQNIVMGSEVKMFLLIGRAFFCMGYVLTQLLYVTELNNLLHCAIGDWFVNDRQNMGLEIAGTGRWALMMRVKPETVEWLLETRD